MRKQYHFWPSANGFDAWDIDRLIELTREYAIEDVALSPIHEVDSVYWFNGSAELPTVRKIVEHVQLINEVDMAFPIILGPDSRVMDGMHRIAHALLDGQTTIRAVRFGESPEPDFRNCRPEDLSYW